MRDLMTSHIDQGSDPGPARPPAVSGNQTNVQSEPHTETEKPLSEQPEQSESQTNGKQSASGQTRQPEGQNVLYRLAGNEDPNVQAEFERLTSELADAYDNAVTDAAVAEESEIPVLEIAYALWDLCRENDQAAASLTQACESLKIKASKIAGEFVLPIKYAEASWKKKYPTKISTNRYLGRSLINKRNLHASALTGVKFHLEEINKGKLATYVPGSVTRLLKDNKNSSSFGSIWAASEYGRERIREEKVKKQTSSSGDEAKLQSEQRTMGIQISEAEQQIFQDLSQKKHNGPVLFLTIYKNDKPVGMRVMSTDVEEIRKSGVNLSTTDEM
jgi:hypothetical protein